MNKPVNNVITIKTGADLDKMRRAGAVTAGALEAVRTLVRPGVTTRELDAAARSFITAQGATPSFLGYRGYPAATNMSVNSQVIHGIPGDLRLKDGDIVSVDVGACVDGFHGDAARTFAVGTVSDEAKRLITATEGCFMEGLKYARKGCHLHDISAAIEEFACRHGFAVVRDFIGHGIGKKLHEPPDVPNYKPRGRGPALIPGMTLAIEPMVNAGGCEIRILEDGWTVVTADGKLSAHYENTIAVTDGEPEVLTAIGLIS